ncbi:hypothetical protein ACG74X_10950 [Marivita sp. S0852]|uniref:hypothetical protein n=1 Tax=Marivita sp. S0852 TaxID=3373893 RepID=UPI003982AA57
MIRHLFVFQTGVYMNRRDALTHAILTKLPFDNDTYANLIQAHEDIAAPFVTQNGQSDGRVDYVKGANIVGCHHLANAISTQGTLQ